MPLLTPLSPAEPVPDGKRRSLALVLAIALAVAVVATWAAVRPDAYSQARAGCVTVTIPSATGGALLHRCGPQARIMCRAAAAHDDRLSRLTRPACRAAGIGCGGRLSDPELSLSTARIYVCEPPPFAAQ